MQTGFFDWQFRFERLEKKTEWEMMQKRFERR